MRVPFQLDAVATAQLLVGNRCWSVDGPVRVSICVNKKLDAHCSPASDSLFTDLT